MVAIGLACLLVGTVASEAWAQKKDLTELPLEALLDLEITSAAKKPQRVADTAADIFVLTQDDIRRSGATTIAEALRLVPGLYIARIDSNTWVVNARGRTGRIAVSTGLLVLVDGRAVYTPIFSLVNWDVQDTVLEDIDRIEVIRGPGAALWGANAVDGVINIITKRARDTVGGLVSVGAGTLERGFGTARYGARIGDVFVRGYTKYFNRGEQVVSTPRRDDAGDAWEVFRAGFRADAAATDQDTLTLIGNGHTGTVGKTFRLTDIAPPFERNAQFDQRIDGFDLLARWERTFSAVSALQVQTYYDHSFRDDLRVPLMLDTFDVETQYRQQVGGFNDFIVGFGYRYYRFQSSPGRVITFTPAGRELRLFSAFLQDDITILPKTLHLILGTRVEHTTYTGLEWEPNARVLWTPTQTSTVWGAVSRAVRTPSILERQGTVATVSAPSSLQPVPGVIQVNAEPGSGSHGVQAEKLLAYQAGYRSQLTPRVAVDVAAFYNISRDLQLAELQSVSFADPPPRTVVVSRFRNGIDSETYGFGVYSDLEAVAWWRLRVAYSFVRRMDFRKHDHASILTTDPDGQPISQAFVRSSMDLGYGVEVDVIPRYIAAPPSPNFREYVEVDARLGWRVTRAVEVSLVGRNLVHSHHGENSLGPVPVELGREGYVKIRMHF